MRKTIILIDGPRGVGKDAVINELIRRGGDTFKYIPSYSTRTMRPGERNGATHWFISEEEFKRKLETGDIFEYEIWESTYRGMSKKVIDDILQDGYIGLKTVGPDGVKILRNKYGEGVLSIFITTKREILIKRLQKLGAPDIDGRMKDYEHRHNYSHLADHIVENNATLEDVIVKIQNIIKEYT